MPTQKQLIEEQNKTLLNILGEISTLKNGQDKIFDYLENNEKTGEKGVIATQSNHEDRIQTLETNVKLTNGKIAIATTVIIGIGSFFTWLLGIFDK